MTVGDTPRLAGGGAFGSGTSDNTSLQLIVAPNGSTITKILVTCGGNPLRPPALGKALIAKHFTASVSLPLTSRIRWAGLVLPDNSTNYDAPIPARWNGRVRYSLDASVRTVDGGYPGSRGQVSCPAQASPARRYVATAEPPLIREHSRGVAQPSIHPLAYGAPSAEPPGVTRANVGISRSYCVRCQAGACS